MPQKGRRILLFDEIEKAHEDMYNLLLQVLDDGFLTTSAGKKLSFKNSVIILTSNVGAERYSRENLGFSAGGKIRDTSAQRLMRRAKQRFPAEFLSRLTDVVAFEKLGGDSLAKIAAAELERLAEKLAKQGITLDYSADSPECISRIRGAEYGARRIKNTVDKQVKSKIARMIMEGSISAGDRVYLAKNGEEISVKTGRPVK